MIHAVFLDRHAGGALVSRTRLQIDPGTVVEREVAARERPVRLNFDLRDRALNGTQVPARIFDFVLHPRPAREMICHANILHDREIHHSQLVTVRADAACFDIIFDVIRNAREKKFVGGTTRLRLHRSLLPFRRSAVTRQEIYLRRDKAAKPRGHDLVRSPPDNLVTGFHLDAIKRLAIFLRQTSPEKRCAVTEEARTRNAEPYQDHHRGGAQRCEAGDAAFMNHLRGVGLLGDIERVHRKQRKERIVGVLLGTFGKRQKAFTELGKFLLRFACRRAAVQSHQRKDQCRGDGEREDEEQRDARPEHAGIGKRKPVYSDDQQDGEDQRGAADRGHSTRERKHPQVLLEFPQVFR